jgi:DNA mismatch repair protein MutS
MIKDVWRLLISRGEEPRMRVSLNIAPVSLLWPAGKPPERTVPAAWEADLGLDELVAGFTSDRRYKPFIRQMLTILTTDTEIITWRQEVLADFLRNPELAEQVDALLPSLSGLRQGNPLLSKCERSLLLETSDRLAELDLYTDVVQRLHKALDTARLASRGLITLRDTLRALLEDENFRELCRQLPELRQPLENITSLTIGINLDFQLRPVSAVLLSINDRRLGESVSFLERLIGSRVDETDDAGIAELHRVPRDHEHRLLTPLFQDLDRLLVEVAKPVARALNRYVRTSSDTLAEMEYELAFYMAAVTLIRRLAEYGVTFCQPEVAPVEERSTHIDGLANVTLALRERRAPVLSRVDFGPDGRIAILTGPNSGGKTTYLQGVGLAQVLFQAGLFVPARQARMSPVDTILTHFPALETRQQGRLAEEAERLREIIHRATAYSLVLLNETLSSTTPREALLLAHDLLCGLRVISVRCIYATHFVELADHIAEVEEAVNGESDLFSLVAGVRMAGGDRPVPTFKVTRGAPFGRSYAQEIAQRYGISLDQILELRRRQNG